MLKVFGRNFEPIGVLPSAYDIQRKRRINSDYELVFTVPMDSADYKEKLALKFHVQDEHSQYYVINTRKRDRDGLKRTVQFSCMHVMFKLSDILMPYNSFYMEEGFGINILTLTNLISSATNGRFQFVINDEFELKDVKDFGRGNCMEILNKVMQLYSAEYDVNNFLFYMKKTVGSDTGCSIGSERTS